MSTRGKSGFQHGSSADDLRHDKNDEFQKRVTATLEAQDRILSIVEQRLESPVLNGGFETLMRKVDKIETIQEQMIDSQEKSIEKIQLIHDAIYDVEKGLYHKVKDTTDWINNVNRIGKWVLGLVAAGVLSGVGKILYDFLSNHIQYVK